MSTKYSNLQFFVLNRDGDRESKVTDCFFNLLYIVLTNLGLYTKTNTYFH